MRERAPMDRSVKQYKMCVWIAKCYLNFYVLNDVARSSFISPSISCDRVATRLFAQFLSFFGVQPLALDNSFEIIIFRSVIIKHNLPCHFQQETTRRQINHFLARNCIENVFFHITHFSWSYANIKRIRYINNNQLSHQHIISSLRALRSNDAHATIRSLIRICQPEASFYTRGSYKMPKAIKNFVGCIVMLPPQPYCILNSLFLQKIFLWAIETLNTLSRPTNARCQKLKTKNSNKSSEYIMSNVVILTRHVLL